MKRTELFGLFGNTTDESILLGYACVFYDKKEMCTRRKPGGVRKRKRSKNRLTITIDDFEILRPFRKQGYGKYFVRELTKNMSFQFPSIFEFQLTPRSDAVEFWKRCGFLPRPSYAKEYFDIDSMIKYNLNSRKKISFKKSKSF